MAMVSELQTTNPWKIGRRGRVLKPGQRSELCIFDTETGQTTTLLSIGALVEAPNWSPDGTTIVVNAGGDLWLLRLDRDFAPARLDAAPIDNFNNDHVLSPDGRSIYASSDDGHIYALPITGGSPRRVSGYQEQPHHCYLHGISPDGKKLVYVAVEELAGRKRTNIFTLSVEGGASQRITDLDLAHDGPEYSPDGTWIYFNSERASPGHSQCFRMRTDGSGAEQLTHDERVNWFPHPSPDGKAVVYLSYPPFTEGHPPDRDVILRLMKPDGSDQRDLIAFHGGQGTINVNSWAPDSTRLAFVAYPIDAV
jgi:TolB protein